MLILHASPSTTHLRVLPTPVLLFSLTLPRSLTTTPRIDCRPPSHSRVHDRVGAGSDIRSPLHILSNRETLVVDWEPGVKFSVEGLEALAGESEVVELGALGCVILFVMEMKCQLKHAVGVQNRHKNNTRLVMPRRPTRGFCKQADDLGYALRRLDTDMVVVEKVGIWEKARRKCHRDRSPNALTSQDKESVNVF
ncbi:hypothetical protein BKA80DRAFT_300174 [Phyllosticta citrichinensis]